MEKIILLWFQSFLSPADREKVAVKSQVAKNTVTDQVKNRLEQLDDFEEVSQEILAEQLI